MTEAGDVDAEQIRRQRHVTIGSRDGARHGKGALVTRLDEMVAASGSRSRPHATVEVPRSVEDVDQVS